LPTDKSGGTIERDVLLRQEPKGMVVVAGLVEDAALVEIEAVAELGAARAQR
jgi:enamine deaminase RidA (YjgF/YER057c/UK114 family)